MNIQFDAAAQKKQTQSRAVWTEASQWDFLNVYIILVVSLLEQCIQKNVEIPCEGLRKSAKIIMTSKGILMGKGSKLNACSLKNWKAFREKGNVTLAYNHINGYDQEREKVALLFRKDMIGNNRLEIRIKSVLNLQT